MREDFLQYCVGLYIEWLVSVESFKHPNLNWRVWLLFNFKYYNVLYPMVLIILQTSGNLFSKTEYLIKFFHEIFFQQPFHARVVMHLLMCESNWVFSLSSTRDHNASIAPVLSIFDILFLFIYQRLYLSHSGTLALSIYSVSLCALVSLYVCKFCYLALCSMHADQTAFGQGI